MGCWILVRLSSNKASALLCSRGHSCRTAGHWRCKYARIRLETHSQSLNKRYQSGTVIEGMISAYYAKIFLSSSAFTLDLHLIGLAILSIYNSRRYTCMIWFLTDLSSRYHPQQCVRDFTVCVDRYLHRSNFCFSCAFKISRVYRFVCRIDNNARIHIVMNKSL